jgi:hypothetical protein
MATPFFAGLLANIKKPAAMPEFAIFRNGVQQRRAAFTGGGLVWKKHSSRFPLSAHEWDAFYHTKHSAIFVYTQGSWAQLTTVGAPQ